MVSRQNPVDLTHEEEAIEEPTGQSGEDHADEGPRIQKPTSLRGCRERSTIQEIQRVSFQLFHHF